MKLGQWIVVGAAASLVAACDMLGGGGEGENAEGEAAVAGSGPAAGAAPAAEAPKPAEAPPPAPDATPAGACAALLEASKADDAAKLEGLSTEAIKGMLSNEAAKAGMSAALKDASCGEAKVDGDKAMIPVTSGDKSRDIPFVKQGEAWKFDAAAYAEKYPAEDAKAKGKKAKKAKGKKKG